VTWAPETVHIDTWPQVYAVLEPAIRRSDSTVTELIDELLDGTAQLWVMRKGGDPVAACVSELDSAPLGPFVHVRLVAGRGMNEWLDSLIECMTFHALKRGAVGISCEGRSGWERVLGHRGWKRRSITMALAFEPEAVS
jgi:hypothetical protein